MRYIKDRANMFIVYGEGWEEKGDGKFKLVWNSVRVGFLWVMTNDNEQQTQDQLFY